MKQGVQRSQHGYILLPVIFVITIIAAIAFMVNRENIVATAQQDAKQQSDALNYITRSGLQHGMWQLQQQGCNAGNSTTTQSLGNHRFTTTITSVATSTTRYIVNVAQDSWIRSDNPTATNGSNNRLHVAYQSGTTERSLVQYDLSSIPANSNVVSAAAWFYVSNDFEQGPVRIHPLTDSWLEASVDWTAMSGNMSNMVLAVVPAQSNSGVWVSMNLTPYVQAWLNGEDNHGIAIETSSEGVNAEFSSREANSNEQPYLEVVVGTGSSSAQITATGTLDNGSTLTLQRNNTQLYQQPNSYAHMQPAALVGKDTYLNRGNTGHNYGAAVDIEIRDNPTSETTGLLQFSLKQIPAHARIINARLELYQNSVAGVNGNVAIHRVMRSWEEGAENGASGAGATWNERITGTAWNTAGGDYEATAVASASMPSTTGWVTWDVSTLVSEWVTGAAENYGLAVRVDGAANATFSSSDNSNVDQHPKLTVTYTCRCDEVCLAPQGNGSVIMIADYNGGSLRSEDQQKAERMQHWGYTVDTAQDNQIAAANVNNYDVIYVSATADDSDINTQLTTQSTGVVFENNAIHDELDIASISNTLVGTHVDINDTSHPITLPFSTNNHRLRSNNASLLAANGSLAAGAQTLASISGIDSLLTIDTNEPLLSGASASGRRVMLPLTFGSNENWRYLSNNGQLIIQRALQWAQGGSCNDGEYRDDFSTVDYSNNDGSLAFASNWNENDPGSTGATDGNVVITGNQLQLDDNPNTNDEPSAARIFNLSGASQSTLRFDFQLGSETDTGSDVALLEISTDGGNSWITLQNFSTYAGGTSGSLSYDLAAHQSLQSQIRFSIASGYSSSNEYLAIDNVSIVICGAISSPTLPVAHWMLDENTGLQANDSVGGHHGTLVNGPSWTNGQINSAVQFDGVNDVINAPHDANLSLTSEITVAAWINSNRVNNAYDAILNKDQNYWFGIYNDELAFEFYTGSSWFFNTTTGVNLQANQWYHVAASFDNANDIIRYYVNGSEVFTRSTTLSPSTNTSQIYIGNSRYNNEDFSGGIDDVRIYDSVLSADEIGYLAAMQTQAGSSANCSAGGTFRDEFNAVSFGNNNGTLNWSADWLEVGESDGAGNGDVIILNDISNYQLRIRDNNNGGEGVAREVDLSGAATAQLTLQRRRQGLDSSNDYVALFVSSNGTAGPWTEIDRYAGGGNDATYQNESYNLSPYISANTAIRLRSSPSMGNNDIVWFDNIQIQCSP